LWLGIAIDLISPTFLPRIKSWIEGTNQSLAGAALLVTAYCLGSAILPISAQLVNDEHWPLPEDAIRCRVTEEEQSRLKLVKYSSLPNPQVARSHGSACACSLWSRVRGGGKTNPKRTPTASLVRNEAVSKEQLYGADGQQKVILAQFEVLENRALGQGTNRDELFRQLQERMIVLRGAVFSGLILFLICLFGCIAPERDKPINRWRTFLGILLVLLCYKKGAPQKGQPESCRSRTLAMVCRRVAMDQGLCRSTRTGRAPRTEPAWHLGEG